jgi:hypothetical protein
LQQRTNCKGKVTISDKELNAILKEDPDFDNFIKSEMDQLTGLENHISNLSNEAKIELKEISEKYVSAEDFRLYGSAEEKVFYEKNISINNKSSLYLANIIKKLNDYNFSKEALINTIKSKTVSNLKQLTCEQISNRVYWDNLYSYWITYNWDYARANQTASFDANWAFIGCLMGREA